MRYCHRVEVLASTRSPALNTGPLPARRLRTVRNTIRPSSLIHLRVHPAQNAKTPAVSVARIVVTRVMLGACLGALVDPVEAPESGRGVVNVMRPHAITGPALNCYWPCCSEALSRHGSGGVCPFRVMLGVFVGLDGYSGPARGQLLACERGFAQTPTDEPETAVRPA